VKDSASLELEYSEEINDFSEQHGALYEKNKKELFAAYNGAKQKQNFYRVEEIKDETQ